MRLACTVAMLLALATSSIGADAKYSVKVDGTPPPKELAEPVRAILSDRAMTVSDSKGKVLCTVWLVKSLESKAKPGEAGLKYSQIDETTIVGAVKFPETWTDYRKQKVKAGVYTLRLGFQPTIDDHVGASEHQEFLLVTAADKDEGPEILEPKVLIERSRKSLESKHPGVFMLFPNPRPALKAELTTGPRNHVQLNLRTEPVVDGTKTGSALGLSLTIVGYAE